MKRSKINTVIGNSLAFLLLTSQIGIAMDRAALKYNAQAKLLAARSTTAPELKPVLSEHVTQGVGSSNEAINEAALEKSSIILEDPSSWTSSSTMIQTQQLVAKVSKAKKAPGHPKDESDVNRFSISVANGLKIAEEANVLSNQISPEMLEIVNEGFDSKDESVQAAYQKILPSLYQSAQSILQSDSQSTESAKQCFKYFENYTQDINEKIKIDPQEAKKKKNEMARSAYEFSKKEDKKNTVKKDKVNSTEHPSSEGDFNSEQHPGSTPLSMSMSFIAKLGKSTNFDEDLKQDLLGNLEAIKKSGNQVDEDTLNNLVDTLNDDLPLDLSSFFNEEVPSETDDPFFDIEENYSNPPTDKAQKSTTNKDKRPVKMAYRDWTETPDALVENVAAEEAPTKKPFIVFAPTTAEEEPPEKTDIKIASATTLLGSARGIFAQLDGSVYGNQMYEKVIVANKAAFGTTVAEKINDLEEAILKADDTYNEATQFWHDDHYNLTKKNSFNEAWDNLHKISTGAYEDLTPDQLEVAVSHL